MCNDVRIIIAAFLGYQHAIDIHAAPNETPESRSNFDSRFKIARPTVNMSSSMANSLAAQTQEAEYKNSLRIPFHDTFQYRGESNLILPNSRFPRLFQLTLSQSYLSLSPPSPLPSFTLLSFSSSSSFCYSHFFRRSCFREPRRICSFHVQHPGVTSLLVLTRERSCLECNVFGDSWSWKKLREISTIGGIFLLSGQTVLTSDKSDKSVYSSVVIHY